MQNLKSDNFVLPFGKYKGMYPSDVAQMRVVDKNGKPKQVGLQYLKWLVDKTNLIIKYKELIQEIINNDDNVMSDEDSVLETETKEITQEINKPKVKKEAKPTEKKTKMVKEGTVQISTENNVLEFQ